ncbi:MAG: bifunctional folylpolyglutamate synthase/dihydrofolate synthase, partial [Endozoicomonas sp.]
MKSDKSLDQWLTWLEATRPEHEIDFGLDRIRLVGEKLNLLKPASFVIMVGGTNGKGSTLAVLESILLSAGYKVGLFTSPHLLKFNERIRINGTMVSDEWLCDSFGKLNSGREATGLTYFEFATLVAVDCFQKANIDVALMEVGMGGRLDATNVIDPDVSIITTVSLDHQEYLGFSIEAIAKEKAGILRPYKTAVFGDHPVPNSVIEVAERLKVNLLRRSDDFTLQNNSHNWSWSGINACGESVELDNLPLPDIVLDNAATAIQALQFMPVAINDNTIRDGLKKASIIGRFQQLVLQNSLGKSIAVILDVAHNPQAAEKLSHR